MKVYLAGGMREEWRLYFKGLKGITFYDPTQTFLSDSSAYTYWDLEAIRQCDVVFAYFESGNSSGIGLACEVGYALGLGKPVFLVNQQPENRYFEFVVKSGVVLLPNLETGKKLLNNLQKSFYRKPPENHPASAGG